MKRDRIGDVAGSSVTDATDGINPKKIGLYIKSPNKKGKKQVY
jgi:hypothetical protein